MDKFLDCLGDSLFKSELTVRIGRTFNDILPLVVSKRFASNKHDDVLQHQRKCIVLAKLLPLSCDIQRFVSALLFLVDIKPNIPGRRTVASKMSEC